MKASSLVETRVSNHGRHINQWNGSTFQFGPVQLSWEFQQENEHTISYKASNRLTSRVRLHCREEVSVAWMPEMNINCGIINVIY